MKNINYKKGFAVPLVILIAVLIIGGGGYLLYRNSEKKNPDLNQNIATPQCEDMVKAVSNMHQSFRDFGMGEQVEDAIKAVATCGEDAVRLLDKNLTGGMSVEDTGITARALAQIGTRDAIRVLLNHAIRTTQDGQENARKQAIISALHDLNKSGSAPELIDALLKSQNQIIFPVVRDTIARLADSSVTRAVVKAYHEQAKEGWQQSNLMGVILRVRSPQAVPALKEIVSTDTDSSMKSQAAIALGLIGTKEAIQALVDTISKTTSIAFMNVLVESLGAVNNKESVDELSQLLTESTNENIRYGVAKALGNISNGASKTALRNALQKESSQRVKQQIQVSLDKIST